MPKRTITYDDEQWQLVPRQPTETMLFHGEHWCDRKAAGIDPLAAEDCYLAMLRAAPEPPTEATNGN